MNRKAWYGLLAAIIAVFAFWLGGGGQKPLKAGDKSDASRAMPPASIPTFPTDHIGRIGFFYAGGNYVPAPGKSDDYFMDGPMYVEVWVPKQMQHPYPIVFFAGAGQIGTDWLQTPDGRPGWAYYLIEQGYTLYMTDYPGRGRSPYVPGVDGPLTMRSVNTLESVWTAVAEKGNFPLKNNHTQWPGTGKMGDPSFDNFAKGQVQWLGGGGPPAGGEEGGGGRSAKLYLDAGVALLDKINGPVILLGHSMGGGVARQVADERPNQVKAIVMVETNGITNEPLHYDPPVSKPSEIKTYKEEKSDGPGENPCTLQQEPVHKIPNLEHIPMVYLSGNGGYHRQGDSCVPKWLNQAGVKTEYVHLEDVGMNGNGHEMFFEKNSDQIIKYIDQWIRKNAK